MHQFAVDGVAVQVLKYVKPSDQRKRLELKVCVRRQS